ncbi:MAG: hypothetical protein V1757_08225 [Actinomycetota bacterium]
MTKADHRFELEPGETLREAWIAGIPGASGKKVKWGGMLFLTDRRLVWEVVKLKRKGSFRVGPSGLALDAVARVADAAVGVVLGDGSGVTVPFGGITGVRGDRDRHAILLVDTPEGTLRYLTTASKWSYNQAGDQLVRDTAVDRIREACDLTR